MHQVEMSERLLYATMQAADRSDSLPNPAHLVVEGFLLLLDLDNVAERVERSPPPAFHSSFTLAAASVWPVTARRPASIVHCSGHSALVNSAHAHRHIPSGHTIAVHTADCKHRAGNTLKMSSTHDFRR